MWLYRISEYYSHTKSEEKKLSSARPGINIRLLFPLLPITICLKLLKLLYVLSSYPRQNGLLDSQHEEHTRRWKKNVVGDYQLPTVLTSLSSPLTLIQRRIELSIVLRIPSINNGPEWYQDQLESDISIKSKSEVQNASHRSKGIDMTI